MKSIHLANWRTELIYAPVVIRRITELGGEFAHFPRGGEASKKRAEEIATMYNERGAAKQPFVTRTKFE